MQEEDSELDASKSAVSAYPCPEVAAIRQRIIVNLEKPQNSWPLGRRGYVRASFLASCGVLQCEELAATTLCTLADYNSSAM